jgi:class 3 adenylate cyclase
VGLKADLENEVADIFRSRWEEREGKVVPDDNSIGLDNDAVKLNATVLYADPADSTNLVDSQVPFVAAELYKTFLHCAAKIIRSEDGEVTAYDGDRVMAVYIGDLKNTRAVRTAMKINYAAFFIVNPAHKTVYKDSTYALKHVVGIDTSELFVAKTGVRGANDLVWVGRAANYGSMAVALPNSTKMSSAWGTTARRLAFYGRILFRNPARWWRAKRARKRTFCRHSAGASVGNAFTLESSAWCKTDSRRRPASVCALASSTSSWSHNPINSSTLARMRCCSASGGIGTTN